MTTHATQPRTTRANCPPSRGTRLTIADICFDLAISRSTFYAWRAKGRGPRCIKLPNGDIRINRAEYERWLTTLEDAA
jgi:predicted DNA-binding transcriptional regulator AlpA